MDSSQRTTGSKVTNVEEGFAYVNGDPYTLMTFSANDDGFLIGLAIKPRIWYHNLNFDDYIQKVKWSKKNP
jgi:hypothetical protein